MCGRSLVVLGRLPSVATSRVQGSSVVGSGAANASLAGMVQGGGGWELAIPGPDSGVLAGMTTRGWAAGLSLPVRAADVMGALSSTRGTRRAKRASQEAGGRSSRRRAASAWRGRAPGRSRCIGFAARRVGRCARQRVGRRVGGALPSRCRIQSRRGSARGPFDGCSWRKVTGGRAFRRSSSPVCGPGPAEASTSNGLEGRSLGLQTVPVGRHDDQAAASVCL
jgi:hypothetical protein